MKYKLKPNVPDFRVVDGRFAGRVYKAGEHYNEKDIPPEEAHKFEPVIESEIGERPDDADVGECIGNFIDEQKKED